MKSILCRHLSGTPGCESTENSLPLSRVCRIILRYTPARPAGPRHSQCSLAGSEFFLQVPMCFELPSNPWWQAPPSDGSRVGRIRKMSDVSAERCERGQRVGGRGQPPAEVTREGGALGGRGPGGGGVPQTPHLLPASGCEVCGPPAPAHSAGRP